MNPLRRPEVIALVLLVLGGVGWVVFDTLRKPKPAPAAPDHRIEITKIAVTPEAGHRHLRLELSAYNASQTPIDMRPPTVRLLDAAGNTIPEFFQPGAFPPSLAPNIKSASWLEFWLDEEQSRQPLSLEIAGRRFPIAMPH